MKTLKCGQLIEILQKFPAKATVLIIDECADDIHDLYESNVRFQPWPEEDREGPDDVGTVDILFDSGGTMISPLKYSRERLVWSLGRMGANLTEMSWRLKELTAPLVESTPPPKKQAKRKAK